MHVGRYNDRGEAETGVAADQERRTVPVLDYALALLSGALLALSFPKFGHPACAWLALTPLVVAVRARSRRGSPAARCAARSSSDSLTGAVYFSGTLYWLVETMTTFGGLPTARAVVRRRRCWSPTSRSFPRAFARPRVAAVRAFRRAALLLAPSIWVDDRVGTPVRLGRFPVGAARLQPGHGAADRADRRRSLACMACRRCSRCVATPRRVRPRRAERARLAGRRRQPRRSLSAVGVWGRRAAAVIGAAQSRHAGASRGAAGEHPAGPEVGSGAIAARSPSAIST